MDITNKDITVEEAHLVSELLEKDKTDLVYYILGFLNKASKKDHDDYIQHLGAGIVWANEQGLDHSALFNVEMEAIING